MEFTITIDNTRKVRGFNARLLKAESVHLYTEPYCTP